MPPPPPAPATAPPLFPPLIPAPTTPGGETVVVEVVVLLEVGVDPEDITKTDMEFEVTLFDAESSEDNSKLYVPVFVRELVANMQVVLAEIPQSIALEKISELGTCSSH